MTLAAWCLADRLLHRQRWQSVDELLNLPSVSRVTARDGCLDRVEFRDKAVSSPYRAEPQDRIDGLGEQTDVFGRQTRRIEISKYDFRVERTCPQAVVDNVVPHLQDKEAASQRLIQSTLTEPIQVVEVPDLLPATPSGELLSDRLFESGNRESGQLELIAPVHG